MEESYNFNNIHYVYLQIRLRVHHHHPRKWENNWSKKWNISLKVLLIIRIIFISLIVKYFDKSLNG